MDVLSEEQWQKDHRARVAAMPPDVRNAHDHCTRNAIELKESSVCGCFYCLAIFKPEEIEEWLVERDGSSDLAPDPAQNSTAFCPKCSIDSVIGSASGFPITEQFLKTMKTYWF
jgi:hypothetical protein